MLYSSFSKEAVIIEIEMLMFSSYSIIEYLLELGEDPSDVAPLAVMLRR